MGNPRWRYKIIPKSTVDKHVQKWRDSLYVEITHQSSPGYHLMLHTDNGEKVLGRVSKKIFKWYELEKMEQQPGYVNLSWHKFKASSRDEKILA